MDLGFSQVELILGRTLKIRPSKRSAFGSRVKNLQRGGMLPDINTGRGIAAVYKPQHVYLLAVALEMTRLFLPPERIIKLVERNTDVLAWGLHVVFQLLDQNENAENLLEIYPYGLEEFTLSNSESEYSWEVSHIRDDEFHMRHPLFIALGVINLSKVYHRLSFFVKDDRFDNDLRAWSSEVYNEMKKIPAANDVDSGGQSVVDQKA